MPRIHAKPRRRVVTARHGYTVIYEGLLEGGYQVIVPALPGIVTYGWTIAEAREMAEDANPCHFRALVKDGEEIPPDRPGRITVSYHERFDLPKHIVKSIVRQVGLTNQEFFRLLRK